jgi:hydroxymethylglutaryl-CoA reductase (NADPH)
MTAPAAAAPGLAPAPPPRREIPRQDDDYTAAAARRRLAFLSETTGAVPEHLGRYSFDPAVLDGNIENFIGVAQVPVGIAGPLLVDGEHARGTFYVPLATTEGALVASYNRGMKLLYAAGGVRTTVVAEAMQRAPAFGFDSAREARAFGDWLTSASRTSRRRPRPAPTSAACTTSSSSRPAGTCSCGSTTPPATRPGRT